jgi:hypothetical protein
MKTTHFYNAVMAALITVIFSAVIFPVLGGCDVDGGSEPDPAAAQLAADINAIKPESATVTGATVTLTGELNLKTDLVVSAGVTLDLTADGTALFLQNGATLTVNGTVNARGSGDHGSGWVDGGLRIGDSGTAAINGSGTISLKGKGRLLEVGANRKLTLDGVTLVGVADNDSSLVRINGGEFVMKSGAITDNSVVGSSDDRGGGVRVSSNGGTFTMEGGAITGNSARAGGGVRLESGGFILKGGEIRGNICTGDNPYGGGVSVRGTFTMEGGAISGNSAVGSSGGSGGGVQVDMVNSTAGIFTMKGGVISGNSANNGGGVGVGDKGTFTMEGGTISGNTASGTEGSGGGVAVTGSDGATFTMEGGTIYGKTGKLPVGVDPSFANSAGGDDTATLKVDEQATAKWGTGGSYTKGGVSQTGGSDICSTDETLIAVPAQ